MDLDNGAFTSETLTVGRDGLGAWRQSGGHLRTGALYVGNATDSNYFSVDEFDQTFQLSGGVVEVTGASGLRVGWNTRGTFVQTGGSASAPVVWVNTWGSVYRMEEGRLDTGYIQLERGRFELGGGEVVVTDDVRIDGDPASALIFDGGRFRAARVEVGSNDGGRIAWTSDTADVTVTHRLVLDRSSAIEAVPGATLHLEGADLEVAGADVEHKRGLSNLTLIFTNEPQDVSLLEVASVDRAQDPEGFVDNMAYGTVRIGCEGTPGSVRLADNNRHRASPEVMYLGELILAEGSTLDLNGRTLYLRRIENDGGQILDNGGSWWYVTDTGDFNGDGALTGLDIPGFKLALADTDAWSAATRRDGQYVGDFNGDGVFNGLDIVGFKGALGESTAIPEPATALAVLTGALTMVRRRAYRRNG